VRVKPILTGRHDRFGRSPWWGADGLTVSPPQSVPPPWWSPRGVTQPVRVVRPWKPRLAGLLLAAAIIAPLAFATLTNPGLAATPTINGRGQQFPPDLLQMVHACTGLTRWEDVKPGEAGWVEGGLERFSWSVMPPVAGNFAPEPWQGPRFVSPDATVTPEPQEIVALMYRGWTVMWYLPSGDPDVIAAIEDLGPSLVRKNPQLVVAPWPLDPAGTWPDQRNVLFQSWRTHLTCATWSPGLLEEFQENKWEAPGVGVPLNEPGPKATFVARDELRAKLVTPSPSSAVESPSDAGE
jgi:hypothetical protein